MFTFISGQARKPSSLLINAAGSWRRVKVGSVRVAGVWRQFYYDWPSMLLKGTCDGNSGNNFHYEDFSTQAYTVASGDKLMFDIYPVPGSALEVGVDGSYTISGTTYNLRSNANIVDQNGRSIHAAPSALAQPTAGKWYNRVFSLTSIAGAVFSEWAGVLESDAAGLQQFYLRDVKILDSAGNVKLQLLGTSIQTPALKSFQGTTSNHYTAISKTLVDSPG